MPEVSHPRYLELLKEWLRKNRFPGDKERLFQVLRILRRMDLKLEESERQELRQLLATTFDVIPEEIVAYMPENEEEERVLQTPLRPSFPSVQGYVGDYIRMTEGQESPESFHAFALLTCLGAALGRRVWIDMTWFKVWPNLSVVLAGPAGGPRKNTAWDMALDVVKDGFENWEANQISDASPQALVRDLGERRKKNAVGFIYAPEFRHFFPNQNYMEGAIPLITRLLDNPDYYPVSRITREARPLRNVTLSMAGGSTLDWLAKLPQDAQGGGFFTRVIIVYEEKPKLPRALPARTKADLAGKVRRALTLIDRYGWGEIKLTEDGRKWFKSWYEAMRASPARTPRLILYYNRKQTHLLRLALLMRLPNRSIGGGDLEQALSLLNWIEYPLGDVYRVVGMSKAGELTKAVLDSIRAMGGRADYSLLMREMKGQANKRDFEMAVETLKGAGQLKEVSNVAEHTLILRELGVVE